MRTLAFAGVGVDQAPLLRILAQQDAQGMFGMIRLDRIGAYDGSIEHVKRELARYHADDVDAYYDIKDPVCDLIWDAAQDWARYTGWHW